MTPSASLYPAIYSSNLDPNPDISQIDFTHEIHMPGWSQPTNDRCGKIGHFISCPNKCAPPIPIDYSCHNIGCPICYPSAVNQMAKRISNRMTGMYEAYGHDGIRLGTLKHMVWSPDPDRYSIDDIKKDRGARLVKDLNVILGKYSRDGVYGGTEIIHVKRKRHIDGSECERHHCHKKHVWIDGVHVHYIGYGYFVNSDIVHARTGWVYKNIQPGRSRDVFDTSYYLLTHGAIFTNADGKTMGQSYRYVGLMSYSKGGHRVVRHEWIDDECPICHDVMLKYPEGIDGLADLNNPFGSCRHPEDIVHWYVNHKRKIGVQTHLAL